MMSGTPHSLTLSTGTPIPTLGLTQKIDIRRPKKADPDYIPLSNGTAIPSLGLSTCRTDPDVVGAAVKAAIKAGYRLIDTATCYQNEEAIGTAIQELIKEGVVKREELFITTKAWDKMLYPGKLEPALKESLKRLKLDYVDLCLAHEPSTFVDDSTYHSSNSVEEIWQQFDAIHEKGLAKAVGVSNWPKRMIEEALALKKTPVHVSQIEIHLLFPQIEYALFCKKTGIVLTSYAALGSPGRTTCQKLHGGTHEWISAMDEQSVLDLAAKHGKTPAQILLRHTLQRGISMIVRSINESHIQENFKIFDFELSDEDIKKLDPRMDDSSNSVQKSFKKLMKLGEKEPKEEVFSDDEPATKKD